MIGDLLIFAGLAALIFFSGKNLAYYGDLIAERLGLGKAWIGLILVASVTSLPELTVGISSVTVVGSADLALGDVLGSCVFNLFLLAIIDAFMPGIPLSSRVSNSHILAAALSIILVVLLGLGLYLPTLVSVFGVMGIMSVVLMAIYLLSMKLLYQFEHNHISGRITSVQPASVVPVVTLKKALIFYLLNAMVVVGAAIFLPALAESLAEKTGLGESFVGTLFLAASTSLPEAAVSIAAVRMGSYDLAVGNLIGSNMFNILIIAIDDFFYTKGYLLQDASDTHLISVLSVVIMSAIAIAGLMYHSTKKSFFLAWDAMLIAGVYLGNLLLLYYFS